MHHWVFVHGKHHWVPNKLFLGRHHLVLHKKENHCQKKTKRNKRAIGPIRISTTKCFGTLTCQNQARKFKKIGKKKLFFPQTINLQNPPGSKLAHWASLPIQALIFYPSETKILPQFCEKSETNEVPHALFEALSTKSTVLMQPSGVVGHQRRKLFHIGSRSLQNKCFKQISRETGALTTMWGQAPGVTFWPHPNSTHPNSTWDNA